jgi:hypothetical protein
MTLFAMKISEETPAFRTGILDTILVFRHIMLVLSGGLDTISTLCSAKQREFM